MHDKIELRKISHHFNTTAEQITLFRDLTLEIRSNEIVSIVGPSGAGKSSLLSIAAGLEKPSNGQIQFSIGGSKIEEMELRANSGFIFQQFHLMPELDALSNLALPLRLRGDKNAFTIAADWLEKVGLSERAKHRPHQLSGGEQQRIAVARAFVSKPRFIFADEPTGNLDTRTSENVANLMFDFARASGCGLVIVTHSKRLALQADKPLQLSDGKLEALS